MAMSAAFACMLLVQSLSAALGKYVYVPNKMRWSEAQSYCRDNHTDLAPVSSCHDMEKILKLLPDNLRVFKQMNSSERETWLWSGDGKVLQCFWKQGQHNDLSTIEDNAMSDANGCYDVPGTQKYPFICIQATVVRERKSWKKAQEHCKKDHRDLASVASHTEMLLIQKELEKSGTSEEAVWTGLRMDRQPPEYQAWGARGWPTYSAGKSCMGLRKKNLQPSYVFAATEPKWELEAYKCNQKLYFICN